MMAYMMDNCIQIYLERQCVLVFASPVGRYSLCLFVASPSFIGHHTAQNFHLLSCDQAGEPMAVVGADGWAFRCACMSIWSLGAVQSQRGRRNV